MEEREKIMRAVALLCYLMRKECSEMELDEAVYNSIKNNIDAYCNQECFE